MKKEKLIILLDAAIMAISDHLNGTETDPSISHVSHSQLESLKEKFFEMKNQVEDSIAPCSMPGIGRVITDQWPFNSKLASTLLGASQAFESYWRKEHEST